MNEIGMLLTRHHPPSGLCNTFMLLLMVEEAQLDLSACPRTRNFYKSATKTLQSPFGFWDPIGFTADGDVDAFKRRRATELKHGRIATRL